MTSKRNHMIRSRRSTNRHGKRNRNSYGGFGATQHARAGFDWSGIMVAMARRMRRLGVRGS